MKKSVALTTIVAVHAAVIGILLIQAGCNSTEEQQPPKASTSVEEVTTIKTDQNVVAEPVETKIKEGDPLLRAQPTKPENPLVDVQNTIVDEPIKKEKINDEPIAPIAKDKNTTSEKATVNTVEYVVKKGDSVSKIASKYRVKSSEILALNSIKNANSIKVGQKLKIPSESAEPVEVAPQEMQTVQVSEELVVYVVKKGDSLSKIAYQNGMSVAQLMQINNLKKANIRIGQKLNITKSGAEKAKKAQASAPKTEKTSPATNGEISHKVKAGEFLGLIASKYKVKISDIKKRNNITDPRKLRAGQTLIIPVSKTTSVAKDATTVKPETKVEQTKTEQPKVEQPKVEAQPVVEQPKVEQPKAPVIEPEKPQQPVVEPKQNTNEAQQVPVIQL